jgi:hypothetical protein
MRRFMCINVIRWSQDVYVEHLAGSRQWESELLYDWQCTTSQFVLASSSSRLRNSDFFQLKPCRHSPYVTFSLTSRWVCHLQLLLPLASTVVLRSNSHRTHDHILPPQIQDSQKLEGQVPLFISPRYRVAQLYPQALGFLLVASYDLQGYGGPLRLRSWEEKKNLLRTALI